jgi:2,4-dienoyl-CoA reductase-like NADH-dependent reductase (Old Yellow Enzyme family)
MTQLFTPHSVGSLTLPNRLVRSATAERMADEAGRPLPKMIALYRQLAEGGVGLVVSGHMYVHPTGKAHPEMTGIDTDELIPYLCALTDAVHAGGGLAAVQINHAGLKSDPEAVPEALAPSAVEDERLAKRTPRSLIIEEIETLIDAYAQAARRAKEAGFDAVQIHAAHGYLVSQFLSPAANKRMDEWGGSLENRIRFLRRTAGAVRAQVGADYPVFVKLGMMDGLEDGLTLEEGQQVVANLKGMGLDAVELSGGFSGKSLVNT